MCPTAVTIDRILNTLGNLAPFSLAEEWDNVGLLVGDPASTVTGILVGLDPTIELLDEAIASGANLLITHHPIIFSALKSIRTDQPAGALIAKAINNQVAVIACHTNLDVVPNGVSHVLAQSLGLIDLTPLDCGAASTVELGFGRVGNLPAPVAPKIFLANLCAVLGLSAVSVAGPLPEVISRVAVCGGSGSDLAAAAHACGAQIYITGEVKHHLARWAEEANFCLIDAGHYATEHLVSESLATQLSAVLAGQAIDIPVRATEKQKNPFSFFMAENDQQPSKERYGH